MDEGEAMVTYFCKSQFVNPFGGFQKCGWWLVIYDGGRKGIPRERKQTLR